MESCFRKRCSKIGRARYHKSKQEVEEELEREEYMLLGCNFNARIEEEDTFEYDEEQQDQSKRKI